MESNGQAGLARQIMLGTVLLMATDYLLQFLSPAMAEEL
jgi:hypothetical protein